MLGGSGRINNMVYLRGHSPESDRRANDWHWSSASATVSHRRLICHSARRSLRQPGFPVVDDLKAGVAEACGRIAGEDPTLLQQSTLQFNPIAPVAARFAR